MVVAAGNRPEHSAVANLLPTPLVSRMIIVNVDTPTTDEWAEWMNETFQEKWDKRSYAFLKRFEGEGYLLKVPNKTETLDPYPTPRTWSTLSCLMDNGIKDDETIVGLVGYEVGQKFEAFLKVNVSLEEVLKSPSIFSNLTVDGKYMISIMLSTWIAKHIKDISNSLPLIDTMVEDSREFLILTCMGMHKSILINFLRNLFISRSNYKDMLAEIVISLKEEIAR